MFADVTSLRKLINGCDDATESDEKSTTPITRDLLGVSSASFTKELDLDSKTPRGWERLLDLKTGKVHFQKIDPVPKFSGSIVNPKFSGEDDDCSLELKLSTPSSSSSSVSNNNEGICTLEKVKAALERSKVGNGKRPGSALPSPSLSSSSAGGMDGGVNNEERPPPVELSTATCNDCGTYLLVFAEETMMCPKCGWKEGAAPAKRPRVDLNLFV